MGKKYNVAIAGATGNVGRKLLEVLEKLNFKFNDLYLESFNGVKIKAKKKPTNIAVTDTAIVIRVA